jgi:hypothetical protein
VLGLDAAGSDFAAGVDFDGLGAGFTELGPDFTGVGAGFDVPPLTGLVGRAVADVVVLVAGFDGAGRGAPDDAALRGAAGAAASKYSSSKSKKPIAATMNAAQPLVCAITYEATRTTHRALARHFP